MAKVSVIIPVYNVEEYLVECMESVVKQTLRELEIICVNDGSTDHSLKILEKYRENDERIILIDQKNNGYGYAMNRGLQCATGEYIGIVEPDDFISLDMYQNLYEIASAESLDFIKADFYRFKRSKNGSMEMNYNHLSVNTDDYNIVFDPSHTPQAIRFIMNTWCGIYRREFLEEYEIHHNETPGASFQDNGFWFQTFIYAKRAMIIDRPYYMNRRDNPNSSINSKEKVYCINAEYDYIRGILMRDQEIWERFRYVYWFKKYHNYMGCLQRIGEEYKKEYLLRFSEELKRGMALGELKKEEFSELAWNNIQRIINDPEEYYVTRVYSQQMERKVVERISRLDKENQELKKEIKRIRSSKSFRVGRMLLSVPIQIRKWIGGKRKRNG